MQRGINFEKLFEQIDPDKIGFVDVEEFHDILEWMGLTITKSKMLNWFALWMIILMEEYHILNYEHIF